MIKFPHVVPMPPSLVAAAFDNPGKQTNAASMTHREGCCLATLADGLDDGAFGVSHGQKQVDGARADSLPQGSSMLLPVRSRVMISTMPFVSTNPNRHDYWRSIILFGRNVASYKFALAKSLRNSLATSETSYILKSCQSRLGGTSQST